jgi:hypothetical protein
LLIILLVLLVVGGGYRLWSFLNNYRPLISSIPLVQPGGQVVADLSILPGVFYPADEHRVSLLLVDPTSTEAVFMDYHAHTGFQADSDGNPQSVTLALPKGMVLPAQVRVYVLLDVFPAFEKDVMP